jgi:serine/threonine-protein kinase
MPIHLVIDGVAFQLREGHDFSWLNGWGRVFRVFDQQDSGNIGFGVERDGIRRFIKYAGAPTVDYPGNPADAVKRLIKAVPVYQDLRHPALVNLIDSFDTDNGFAMVFEWVDGECLHSHWLFSPQEKYTHPASPNYRFNRLPLAKRLNAFERILSFHTHAEAHGYLAVDFYDGSILYDFETDQTRICDIDFYRRRPLINTIGRMWGSSRFMAPEEFELGAAIDQRTNVFTMGAMAFACFGGTLDRSFAQWTAGEALYQVALQAVSKKRADRQATVAAFRHAWEAARAIGFPTSGDSESG